MVKEKNKTMISSQDSISSERLSGRKTKFPSKNLNPHSPNEKKRQKSLFSSPQKSNAPTTANLPNSILQECNFGCDSTPSVSKFLRSFRENGAHFISSAYLISSQASVQKSIIDGSLFTTLSEDVFTLINAQLALLDEFLVSTDLSMTDTGDAVAADALLSIFRILHCKQIHYGRSSPFLRNVETCVARANDYWIMGEKIDSIMQSMSKKHYPHLTLKSQKEVTTLAEWNIATELIEQEASKLIDQMNSDAAEASNRAAVYMIREIQQLDIPKELFSRHWEEDLTSNEVAKYIVQVYTNYLADMKQVFVSDCLCHKLLITLARCTICFYLKCFIFKASRVRRSNSWYDNRKERKEYFRNPRRALMRMTYDIELFEDFFLNLSNGSTAVTKIISNEFSLFRSLFLECSSFAVGENSPDFLQDFILVLHKRTGADSSITRYFLSDVFILMGEKKRNYFVRDSIASMKEDLDRIKESMQNGNDKSHSASVMNKGIAASFFQLDEMLKSAYAERIIQENAIFCGIIRKY